MIDIFHAFFEIVSRNNFFLKDFILYTMEEKDVLVSSLLAGRNRSSLHS
jgi:hypothetical protein